jgi:hypothetical protein
MNFTSSQLQPLQTLDVFYIIRPPLLVEAKGSIETSTEEPEAKRAKVDESKATATVEEGKSAVAKLGLGISRLENEKSVVLFNSTEFDGLLICSKEHPLSILQNLAPHLASGAPFVIFCQYPEVSSYVSIF